VLQRSTCTSCKHSHSSSRPCHVWIVDKKAEAERAEQWSVYDYTEDAVDSTTLAAYSSSVSKGSVLTAESTSESSSSSSDYDSDDDSPRGSKKPKLASKLMQLAVNKAAELAGRAGRAIAVAKGTRPRHHISEKWGTDGCLKRCNCDAGVPDEHPGLFAPVLPSHLVAHPRVAEQIATRDGPPDGAAYALENRAWESVLPPPVQTVGAVLKFLDARQCALCARVCTAWWSEAHGYESVVLLSSNDASVEQ
jgi:hypothetical protein